MIFGQRKRIVIKTISDTSSGRVYRRYINRRFVRETKPGLAELFTAIIVRNVQACLRSTTTERVRIAKRLKNPFFLKKNLSISTGTRRR